MSDTVYFAIGQCTWGKGETQEEAVARLVDLGGPEKLRMYSVHRYCATGGFSEAFVDAMGSICVRKNNPGAMLETKRVFSNIDQTLEQIQESFASEVEAIQDRCYSLARCLESLEGAGLYQDLFNRASSKYVQVAEQLRFYAEKIDDLIECLDDVVEEGMEPLTYTRK